MYENAKNILGYKCIIFLPMTGLRLNQSSVFPLTEQRLRTCDECLRRSYGPNLERLAVVKGETGIERALFMRLHLLQAITAFHKGQAAECAALLNRVSIGVTEMLPLLPIQESLSLCKRC